MTIRDAGQGCEERVGVGRRRAGGTEQAAGARPASPGSTAPIRATATRVGSTGSRDLMVEVSDQFCRQIQSMAQRLQIGALTGVIHVDGHA